MAESKYGKYIINGIPEKEKEKMAEMMKTKGESPGKMLLYTDGGYNEGVYYFTTQWVYGPSEEGIPPVTHDHSYNEYLGFFGSEPIFSQSAFGDLILAMCFLTMRAGSRLLFFIHIVLNPCILLFPGTPIQYTHRFFAIMHNSV